MILQGQVIELYSIYSSLHINHRMLFQLPVTIMKLQIYEHNLVRFQQPRFHNKIHLREILSYFLL